MGGDEWGLLADAEIDRYDDAEVDRVHADLANLRHDDGNDQNNRRRRVEKHSRQ